MSMRPSKLSDYTRVLRFAMVGVLNTALGYSIILAALALGCSDLAANGLGYAGGLVLGFVLNSRWTFSTNASMRKRSIARYAVAFAIAYAANLMAIAGGLSLGYQNNPFVHLGGICLYTAVFYIASSRFVFVEAHGNSKGALREPR